MHSLGKKNSLTTNSLGNSLTKKLLGTRLLLLLERSDLMNWHKKWEEQFKQT